jgi:hypothetical protein
MEHCEAEHALVVGVKTVIWSRKRVRTHTIFLAGDPDKKHTSASGLWGTNLRKSTKGTGNDIIIPRHMSCPTVQPCHTTLHTRSKTDQQIRAEKKNRVKGQDGRGYSWQGRTTCRDATIDPSPSEGLSIR